MTVEQGCAHGCMWLRMSAAPTVSRLPHLILATNRDASVGVRPFVFLHKGRHPSAAVQRSYNATLTCCGSSLAWQEEKK